MSETHHVFRRATAEQVEAILSGKQRIGGLWFYRTRGPAFPGAETYVTYTCPDHGCLGDLELRSVNKDGTLPRPPLQHPCGWSGSDVTFEGWL